MRYAWARPNIICADFTARLLQFYGRINAAFAERLIRHLLQGYSSFVTEVRGEGEAEVEAAEAGAASTFIR